MERSGAMGKIAFVFSGQGAQYSGMGKSLYEVSQGAKKLYDACEKLRPGTMEQSFSGSEEELRDTKNTQPCMYLVELSAAEALREHGITADGVAGFSLGEISENLECDIKARYTSTENQFLVCSGKDEMPLTRFLTDQPLIYKTVKDMTITGTDVIEGDFTGDVFDNDILEKINWEDYHTDKKLEFRKDSSDKRVSIQDALYQILEKDKKYKYIIYDHGTGEIADYITIHETENELVVELYHVKKMSSSSYNNSVGDVYEVSGQAIKSVIWFATKGKLIEKLTSRHSAGHCIIKKGNDFKTMIKELKSSSKVLRGAICIVQPGLKRSEEIPDKIQEVLAATDLYVKKAGKVNRLRIMGSI